MRLAVLVCLPLLLAADWPQHLGPNRDGHSPETGLLRTWPKEGPAVAWKHDVGSGWAGPVVAGERLIAFHRFGDEDVLECLHPATGKPIWKSAYRTKYVDDFGFDEGPRATPLIAGDRVFTYSAEGELRASDLASGKSLWSRNVNADYKVAKGFFGAATSPLIAGGKLLLNVGAKGAGVVAFDPATGAELWKAGNDAVSYSSPVLAKLGGEELAVFFTREGLLAVTPDKGEVRFSSRWKPRNQSSVNAATPIVSGDRVLLTTSYDTGAILFEVSKGKLTEVWQGDNIISCHYNTPVLVKDYLYGIDGRQEGGGARLTCVEWATGKIRWTKEAFGCSSLIHADGMLIACVENGDIALIEPTPDGYKELTRASVMSSPVRAAPALANGKLFVRDGKKLTAIDLTSRKR